MTLSTISSKGQITIPVDIREKFELKQGDVLDFVVQGDEIYIKPVANKVRDAFGSLYNKDHKVVSIDEMNNVISAKMKIK